MTQTRKKRAGTYHHGTLRMALIEAAAELVAEAGGADAINMRELARRTGVSSGAPFRHFADRAALLVAIGEEGATRMVREMDEASAGCADPVERERARGVAYVRWCVANPGFFRVLYRPDVLGASALLTALTATNQAQLDDTLGRSDTARGDATPSLASRAAGTLAAQALLYGLCRMILDGLLGEVTPDEAARLALELTGVLGVGLDGLGLLDLDPARAGS